MTDAPAPSTPSDDGVEVEWQFDALDLRPVERWLAALPAPVPARDGAVGSQAMPGAAAAPTALAKPARRLIDHYLDTADWRIGRAGFVLRTRSRGRHEEATLKDTRPPQPGGLRRRLEVTEALPDGGLPALGGDGPVGRRLAAVAGRRPYHQVLEVRTRRRPYSLRVGDEEVAELALDDTVITTGSGQQPVRLLRVEVEVAPAWVPLLEPVVDELRTTCGLRPATLSKFEAGLLGLGLSVPGLPELGPTEVTPTSTLGDLAFAVVRTQLGVLLAREPGTRLGEDIEDLHDMRVATRRLRAAIELFADALPVRAQTLRDELRWVAGVLGRVRDLDVQIERMDEMAAWALGDDGTRPPLEELGELLEAQRVVARRALVEALDSARWERLVAALVDLAQHGQGRRLPATRAAAALTVPDLVAPRHRAVVKAARRARRSRAAADFHRLRIRCKRLRYSLEFTAGIYGGRTERFTKKLAKLQDALGLMQDAEVATARLLDLAVGSVGEHALSPRTVFAMGAVAERYREESERLLSKMPKRLALLQGDEWHSLAVHMQRRQSAAAAVLPPQPAPRVAGGPPAAPPPEMPALPPAVRPGAAAPAGPATPAATAGPVTPAAAVTPAAHVEVSAHVEPAAPTAAETPAWWEAGPSAGVEPGAGTQSPVDAALSAWPDVVWGPPSGGLPEPDDPGAGP